MTATITVPPSANQMRKAQVVKSKTTGQNIARQSKSGEYKAWLGCAVNEIKSQMKAIEGPVWVNVRIFGGEGFNPQRDIDNCIKPVLDALVRAGILKDDSVGYVRHVEANYYPPAGPEVEATCMVEVCQ